MSVRHTYLFDRPNEFRFDAGRVEIASGVARIKQLADATTDLALGKAITATSSAAGHEPAKMLDGDPQTSWATTLTGPHEIEIDLGRLLWLNRLEIDFALGGLPGSAILYLSEDGVSFDEIANLPSVTDDIDQTFTAVRYRYVKIVLTDSDDTLEIVRLSLKGPIQYYDDANLYLLTPGVLISAAEQLAEVATKPAETGIRYFWVIDGVAKYFDGAAWVNSDRTWNQASALTSIPPLAQKSWVRLGVVLRSLDGTARPSITSCSLDAGMPASSIAETLTCLIFGTITDLTGDPLPGREIIATPARGSNLLPHPRSVISDEFGYWEMPIERGLTGVTFNMLPEDKIFIRNIPNAASAEFKDLA